MREMIPRQSMLLLMTAAAVFLPYTVGTAAQKSKATQRLLERNKMFKPRIIKVSDNVYSAIGYTVSANSMIIGEDGIVIVDPGQTLQGALRIRAEFEKITDKPVRAIVYTHSHGDHTNGAGAFFDEEADIQVWARSNFGSERARAAKAGLRGVRPVNTQGFDLQADQKIGIGIAIPPDRRPSGNIMRDGMPRRGGVRGALSGRVMPTHRFDNERQTLEIAGVNIELVAAPGETADQLYVWFPKERVVFSGDNFYQSWPNVYPLRGTARRSIRDWISSVDKMVKEEPLHVVAGHTAPMLGNAVEVLTNYRDAMRWVHDKTIEGAQKFLTPDELVAYAALPERFARLDYLADYYGSVEGTIRDIYAQDLGWFDGDPLTLHRENPLKQSERMAALLGGVDVLMRKAREALKNDDPLGAAQLAQHVVRLRPDDAEPKLLMADALAIIGERTFNAPMRNYTIAYSNRLRRQAKSDP